jgi:SAM-dependent methyltransferase
VRVHAVVPAGFDDPGQPTGGNIYDRRVCAGLAESGWEVLVATVTGTWPAPGSADRAGLARVLSAIPDGETVLIDGLLASPAAAQLLPHIGRVRMTVLLHMPLATALDPPRDARTEFSERSVLRAAAAVVVTSEWTRRRSVIPDTRGNVETVDVVRLETALERARAAAYSAGEYVGQESFMRAAEIRMLARQARVGPGVSVLDLCCGVAGPGRLIAAESGCRYLGVDHSARALATARRLAGELPCRFEHAHLPPLPDGRFEVIFLLETMLAFPDKEALTGEVARVLEPGGRFAFTVEEGRPLTRQEQARMPAADTVWPVELAQLTGALRDAGLTVTWQQDYSSAHHATATALLRSYLADSPQIAGEIGTAATAELITAHQLWSDWLGRGRVRKFAMVAEKR